MIPRYQTEAMTRIFSDENKFRTWFLVEIAYLDAYLKHEKKPDQTLIDRLHQKAISIDWVSFVARVSSYERDTRHDVIAFLHALEDELANDARLIHLGLTSSDVVDTSLALLLKEASLEIDKKLSRLIDVLFKKAQSNRGVLCLGRTHGQGAEPLTFGIKLLSHVCEFMRGQHRLKASIDQIATGKLSGAVGIYTHTHPTVEEDALLSLGLTAETVATQVVARDRHASLFAALAIIAGSIERLALEIRLLMHGEVQEVSERFFAKQKGSSAMPHKKNPIGSENLTGLARLVRSYAIAALENQALWHERDISHSSVERVIAPDAFSIMDFALNRLCDIVENLQVDDERMKKNLLKVASNLSSQAVMIALVKKGMMRQQAYEIVQKAALINNDKSLLENLKTQGILKFLDEKELRTLCERSLAIEHETILFERVSSMVDLIHPQI